MCGAYAHSAKGHASYEYLLSAVLLASVCRQPVGLYAEARWLRDGLEYF